MEHGHIVAIESAFFPNTYLRLDGRGVSAPVGPGGGLVNCQIGCGPWERFRIHRESEHLVAFESEAFANVFLRLDGGGLGQSAVGGRVNGQFGAGPYETFTLIHAGGKVAIASTAFGGAFLRMDATGFNHAADNGGGLVNVQLGLGPWTVFNIHRQA